MAQGPGREGCDLWGRSRSHTLEKVVLESWGSQHSRQLRKQVCSDLETDTDGFWGSPDRWLMSHVLFLFPTPAILFPCLASKWAPKAHLSTEPFVALDQNVDEREEGSKEWKG